MNTRTQISEQAGQFDGVVTDVRQWHQRVVWGIFGGVILLTLLHLPLLPGYYDWRITVQGVTFAPGVVLLVDMLDILFTVGMAALGALIVTSQQGNRIGWLIAIIGLGSAVLRLTGHYAFYAYIVDTGGQLEAVSLPFAPFAAWVQHWLWVPVIGLEGIAIPLLFPNGRLPSRWWWLFVIAVVAWVAFGTWVIAFHPFIPIENYFVGSGLQPANPYSSQAVADFVEPVFFSLAPRFFGIVQVMIVIGNLSLLVRYVRADSQQRQQIKWFAYAVVFAGILFVLRNNFGGINSVSGLPAMIEVVYLLVTSAMPIILGIAIFQYRLWEIDTVINRTVVYAVLTAVLLGLYLLVVVVVGSLFETGASLSASLLATLTVAASFQGLRERIQRGVNRLMFGQRDEPQAVLLELSRQLKTAVLPAELLQAGAETIARTLQLPYVAIIIRRGMEQVMQTTYGTQQTPENAFDLVYQNEVVGELIVGQRSVKEALSPTDHVVLDGIAQQMGAVVYAVSTQSELQTARERLVTTREEERRRLRRDLHDGLGPALASQPLHFDIAIEQIHVDPALAIDVLQQMKQNSQGFVNDIRRIIYDLRPPALDELGLVEALKGAVSHTSNYPNSTTIAFDADSLPGTIPAATEVAAYRITMEAVTNIVKHAKAGQCWVKLAFVTHPPRLQITIEDDGIGIPQPVTPNVGLRSMRERAEELGGTFEIQQRAAGGTCICVTIPISEESNGS